jgi:hypothetical protein
MCDQGHQVGQFSSTVADQGGNPPLREAKEGVLISRKRY